MNVCSLYEVGLKIPRHILPFTFDCDNYETHLVMSLPQIQCFSSSRNCVVPICNFPFKAPSCSSRCTKASSSALKYKNYTSLERESRVSCVATSICHACRTEFRSCRAQLDAPTGTRPTSASAADTVFNLTMEVFNFFNDVQIRYGAE